jgi:HrpA-like RNA helicase
MMDSRSPATLHSSSRCRFSTGSSAYEVIHPDEVAFLDSPPNTTTDGSGDDDTAAGTEGTGALSFASSLAWSITRSPALPSTFTEVEVVDPFARPRMLSFVRRYRTTVNASDDHNSNNNSSSSSSSGGDEFITEELPCGGVFHARLHVPVTTAAARFLDCVDDAAVAEQGGMWAHGVANTAKDAELLAAMHAERMADLLGYHIYNLPSKQQKHAEAARLEGRYASSPEDTGSGPSAQERREQWPLPLRRVLTDEETEGGKWQLVDTSSRAARFLGPDHTLLSPCLLDPKARVRVEGKFDAAPSGCPSFTQQLRVEKVRTLTASNAAGGGAYFIVAQLELPVQLTKLAEPVVASGKAEDRTTAVLLACMHAELLLDALNVPLFNDPVKQSAHTAAAWSFGRPAPIAGAKLKIPSHVHLPDPLKQLAPTTGPATPRMAVRSAEEDFFHCHDIITEQTGSFIETTSGESNAVEVLCRFLQAHDATRAAAPFLQVSVAGRIKSTVLLPLPKSYGIRGGVGIAANARDADTLAAMHALDVLCMFDIPVMEGDSARAASTDAAWKAARRARIAGVPAVVSDIATPSPPARRCSARALASVVNVELDLLATAVTVTASSEPSPAAGKSTAESAAQPPAGRRRVKRARLASEAAAAPASPSSNSITTRVETSIPPTQASSSPSSSSPSSPQGEAEEREARLVVARATIDKELWDLAADSPDGYIMISPGAQQASAVAEYAIVSPRKLDKQAKSRVIEYLSTVGRRLDDVRFKQSLEESETEGRPRHRCVLKLPLPASCGEPRLALGEADNAADAEHAACMHAELLLDTLGVCIFTDAVKQLRHAEACAQWGRWAPTGPGQEKPPTTRSPPPLRREHAGSLHWERKQAATTKTGGAGFGRGDLVNKTLPAAPVKQLGSASVARKACDDTSTAAGDGDCTALYDYVKEEEIDLVARNRVQYFLRHERLNAGTPSFTSIMGRGVLTHVVVWELPLPARLTGGEGTTGLSYTVKGAATTRKDADALSWMHAERLLDALGIPLFPNLPQLQAYHAAQVEKAGRHAPRLTCDPPLPLKPVDQIPIKPLRLGIGTPRFNLTRPTVPSPEEATSTKVWEEYVTACDVYIAAMKHESNNAFFLEDRVPRTGDAMVDAALAEAEAGPIDRRSVRLLMLYAGVVKHGSLGGWVFRTAGELVHRVTYATVPVPGFEYVLAHGVGDDKKTAKQRAAMHALAILRRIDPDYEDTYEEAKAALQLDLNKSCDTLNADGTPGKDDEDEFDLDSFSTLPSITTEVHQMDNLRSRRYKYRMRQRFVNDAAGRSRLNQLTDEGKQRAVKMYALCCGLKAPVETSLVRLLPRDEEKPPEVTSGKSGVELGLDATVQSVTDVDAKARRVPSGATYAVAVSLTDEDGSLWTGRGSGFGTQDNRSAAYDQLFSAMNENLPLMKKVSDLFLRHIFLRPEEVPCVSIPASISERIRACLRNQKDLLIAESESGSWDSQKFVQTAEERLKERKTHFRSQGSHEEAEQQQLKESEVAATVAAESAALLERLQWRITNPVYLEKYAGKRAKLSIAEHKEEILQSVRNNQVTIICGTTGCGKTTQIPQYILDEATQEGVGGQCNVIVTQPRRLSAISIAKRVSEERMEDVGESTGYMVRFDSRVGRHLNYVTTGVLLRLLQVDSSASEYTHLIIDEIHERDMTTDFLLVLLRELIQKRPALRLVLMSATVQASEFQRYFNNAPLIQVQGHMFPVKELFLEDLVPYAEEHQRMTPLLKEVESVISGGTAAAVSEPPLVGLDSLKANNAVIDANARLRYDVLETTSKLDLRTVTFAIEQATRLMDLKDSSILVFLPGWNDIKLMQAQLEFNTAYYVLLLHSTVSQEAQMRCFLPAPPGKIKVILSTNIAESGVTIDDVGVVIDSGRTKEKSYATRVRTFVQRTLPCGYDYVNISDNSRVTGVESDNVQAQRSFSQLLEVYASRANCVQRRGRVGRTRPGICIRLYTRDHFERLHQYQTPEMLRTPLDSICLTILALNIESPATFLSRALEPPQPSEVVASMKRLTELGAVSADGKLTALGYRLAHLPVRPSVGKTILLGAAFNCLDSILTVAAAEHSDLFVTSRDERRVVRLHREDLSMGTLSDSLASVNAYNFWVMAKLNKSPAEVAVDIKTRCLNVPALLHTSLMKRQLFHLLVDTGFVSTEDKASEAISSAGYAANSAFVDTSPCSQNALHVGLVKAVIAAGLFPNIAILSGRHALRTNFDQLLLMDVESSLRRSNLQSTSTPFVVYRELNRLSEARTLSAKELTVISFWAILLLGTPQMNMEYHQELSLCVVDDWLFFRAAFGVVEQIRKLKVLLDRRLNRKYAEPGDAANNAQLDVLRGILSDLITAPFHPFKELHPAVVWEEKGVLIAPKSNEAITAANDSDMGYENEEVVETDDFE